MLSADLWAGGDTSDSVLSAVQGHEQRCWLLCACAVDLLLGSEVCAVKYDPRSN